MKTINYTNEELIKELKEDLIEEKYINPYCDRCGDSLYIIPKDNLVKIKKDGYNYYFCSNECMIEFWTNNLKNK